VSTEQIGAALGFTLEELVLNKAGRLSPGQWWMLIKPVVVYLVMVLGMIAAMPAIVVFVKPLLLRGLALVVSGVGALGFGWFLVVGVSALVHHRVANSQGVLSFSNAYRGVDITIGDFSGTVSSEARRALVSGGAYRIYYVTPSNRLLSIEELPPDHLDEAPTSGTSP
jgi:hypothetical protein